MPVHGFITKSNYFGVKNGELFDSFIRNANATKPIQLLWTDAENGGKVSFSCPGTIFGHCENDDKYDFDLFINQLQGFIKDGDACIITYISLNEFEYKCSVVIITSQKIFKKELNEISMGIASWLLCDQSGRTTPRNNYLGRLSA